MSITLLAGRVASSARVIQDAKDAERLGFKRIWVPERYTVKEAGVTLGAVAASTERIGVGTGPMTLASRPPAVTASIGSTIQSIFGDRFAFGVGRGPRESFIKGHGFGQVNYETLVDWVGIIKALWRGETVNYDGPAGKYEELRMVDLPDQRIPETIFFHMGGPKASRVAADPVFDSIGLANLTTAEAMRRSIQETRAECERIGRDPSSLRFIGPVTTVPDADEATIRREIAVRILLYLQLPQLGENMRRINGWDEGIANEIRNLPLFAGMSGGQADQNFQRDELIDATQLVPEEWMTTAAAVGTADECVKALQLYRDAGVDEIDIYAGSPAENATLIRAWREHTTKGDES
jgi:probable F420-dependent oxidoreductase